MAGKKNWIKAAAPESKKGRAQREVMLTDERADTKKNDARPIGDEVGLAKSMLSMRRKGLAGIYGKKD